MTFATRISGSMTFTGSERLYFMLMGGCCALPAGRFDRTGSAYLCQDTIKHKHLRLAIFGLPEIAEKLAYLADKGLHL